MTVSKIITDSETDPNYETSFAALLIKNRNTSISLWSYDDLIQLRVYLGRELSLRKLREEDDAS